MLNMSVPEGANVYLAEEGPYFGLKNKTWCFERAVLLGSNMFGFPDLVTAHEFRRVVYERFDMPAPVTPSPPPTCGAVGSCTHKTAPFLKPEGHPEHHGQI